MLPMIAARMGHAVNFAENNYMSKVIVFLLAMLLFPLQASAGWSAAGVASTMQGYDAAERQRLEDEAVARKNQMDQWRFEQEKKQRAQQDIDRARAEKERNDKQSEKEVAGQVQAIIDRNPTLKNWQLNEPDKWKLAVQYDDFLRSSEEYKNLSIEERFNLVAKVMSERFEYEARIDTHKPSSDWAYVGLTDGNFNAFFYVNKKTLSVNGKSKRSAWVLTNYSKNQYDKGVIYDSSKSSWAIDCAGKKTGTKQSHLFMREDSVWSGRTTDKPIMDEVIPDSIGESVLKYICTYKP